MMNELANTNKALQLSGNGLSLDQMVAIWLHSKKGHSGSEHTARAYRDTIRHFREACAQLGLDLDGERGILQTLAQGWAAVPWRADLAQAGIEVDSDTHNKRLAALSSFYEFGIGRGWFLANPIKGLERRKVEIYSGAQPMNTNDVAYRLAQIDRSTPTGDRDFTLLFLGLATGRRAMEIGGLHVGDITFTSTRSMRIFWRRVKGGGTHTDTIEDQNIIEVLRGYLVRIYGNLKQTEPGAAVWPSFSNNNRGQAISYYTLRNIIEARLGTTEFHTLRHTFTHMMTEQKATIEEKQAALLHAHINTTQLYDRSLHGQVNPHAGGIAQTLLKN